MRIDNIRIEQGSEHARVVARVTWEDCDRPMGEVYFATLPAYAEGLSAKAEAFLPAFALLAAWYEERRLKLEGSVCPLLFEGVDTNLRTLRATEGWERPPPVIEVDLDLAATPHPRERTGMFLSGGIDSLFALRRNRNLVPCGHPYGIQDALHVQGAGFPEDPGSGPESRQAFEAIVATFATITEDTSISLIPVLSNLRTIAAVHSPHFARFWDDHFHKAAIASVAHAFGNRMTKIVMASGAETWTEPPGVLRSVPHNYSSTSLQVVHFASFSRFEKTKTISEWPVGLHSIRVCTEKPGSNCGRCLKCVWTRTALAALDKLEVCQAFESDNIDPQELRLALITPSHWVHDYETLLAPLEAAGRNDLLTAVHEILAWAGPWDKWRDRAISDLTSKVPRGSSVVLVDDAALRLTSLIGKRKVIPFLEKYGEYYGSPATDDAAIQELERLRGAGAEFLAIAWPSDWWLDVYRGWAADLRARFACVLDNPGVTIFDLRAPAKQNEAA